MYFINCTFYLSETSMGAIPFGSVTEMRYGSDVVALFLPG
jgi:hypothetical protein